MLDELTKFRRQQPPHSGTKSKEEIKQFALDSTVALLGAWILKQFSTVRGALRQIPPIENAYVDKCPGQD